MTPITVKLNTEFETVKNFSTFLGLTQEEVEASETKINEACERVADKIVEKDNKFSTVDVLEELQHFSQEELIMLANITLTESIQGRVQQKALKELMGALGEDKQ